MNTYAFNLRDEKLRKIIKHTTIHKDSCSLAYTGGDEKDPDTVYIVKDDGCYIMACTDPPLKLEPDNPDNPRHLVAYAEGAGPDDDWIGGDDFAENLPADWFRRAINGGKSIALVTFKGDKIHFKAS